ncbi:MAG: class I SAM-dependent methyltransferase [Prevotellaceae bacterium]|jgi:2-polyprenyl-3-methyl-5-hydroxy-6-metoxy-1,4-benzoquinol methylase|nr:class I SAM-dependent methyltransferase [Prevotellaceae bacterium]
MENQLANKETWKNYWMNANYAKAPKHPIYEQYIPKVSPNGRFIEIGGFPGTHACYFYKHVCRNVTLLDFYVDSDIIHSVEERNQIPVGTIHTIEADFLKFSTSEKYDIVFSYGFIEHFKNIEDIIKRHCDLLTEQGTLLIVLPNLLGINGLIQYLCDRETWLIHNTKTMNRRLLRQIAAELGLKDIQVEYTRKPMVWLEKKPGQGRAILRVMIKLLSYAMKLFPIKCKLLSPFIVLAARK